MKTSKLLMSVAALTASLSVGAQTSFDAAKLYEEELNGTARYMGMAGAMSALGSDPSVIGHNPAGIGTYRTSDLNASVSFFGTSTNTDPLYTAANQGLSNGIYYYSGNLKSDINMSLDNVSVVFSGYDGGDRYMNFGFSYHRLQNMDRTFDYLDKFFEPDKTDPTREYVVYRQYTESQRNKINAFDFNLSCNLSDMLYLGWTLGILSTDTWSESSFYDYYPSEDEVAIEDAAYLWEGYGGDRFEYTMVDKMNSSKGSGLNMAFGVIIRPVPGLRLGASVKTPTYFKQNIEYQDYLYAYEGTAQSGEPYSPTPNTDYKFTSPWKLNLSAGLTFGHTAIGAEYEKNFTQRSSLSVNNTKMLYQGANDYKDFSTFRIGLEQNIGNLALRGGYSLSESMFKDNAYVNLSDSEFNNKYRMDWQNDRPGKTKYYTCGLGYCSEPDRDGTQFYFDLAYVHGVRSSVFNTNEPGATNIDVNYNYNTDKVLFTVGWNF